MSIEFIGPPWYKYPEEIVRTIKPQIINLRIAVGAHFKRRHEMGNTPVRNWIREFRRIDVASGYSRALRQIGRRDNPITIKQQRGQ